jgi:hypothetical protein
MTSVTNLLPIATAYLLTITLHMDTAMENHLLLRNHTELDITTYFVEEQ